MSSRGFGAVLPWIALALLAGSRSRRDAAPARTGGHPGGRPEDERPETRTAPHDPDEWMATRLASLRRVIPEFFPAADAWTREQLARAFLTLFWRETGRSAEFNNNPGNLTLWGNQPGHWHTLPNRDLHYRAYDSLDEGIRDFVRVISSQHYRPATDMLVHFPVNVVGWYEDLALRGYSGHTPAKLEEIRREATNLRQRIENWTRAHEAH